MIGVATGMSAGSIICLIAAFCHDVNAGAVLGLLSAGHDAGKGLKLPADFFNNCPRSFSGQLP